MMMPSNRRNNDMSKGILDFLKAIKRKGRKTIKKRVTIIKFRRNQRICKKDSGVGVK